MKHPDAVPGYYECNEAKCPRAVNKVVELKKYACHCASQFLHSEDFIEHLNVCGSREKLQCTECEIYCDDALDLVQVWICSGIH